MAKAKKTTNVVTNNPELNKEAATLSTTPAKKSPSMTTRLKTQVASLKNQLEQVNIDNLHLSEDNHQKQYLIAAQETKLQLIASIIFSRLDGDGVNDLEGLSGKINWFFVVRNIGNIASMIKEIIAVVKK